MRARKCVSPADDGVPDDAAEICGRVPLARAGSTNSDTSGTACRPTSVKKNSRLKTGPGASPLGLFATHVRVVHTELRQDGASRSFVPLAMRASASPMRRLAPPRSRVRRPNPGISGFWAPGRGAASMACFGRVGGSAGGGSARLGEHRSARSRTVASCTRDRRGRYASDGLSPTRTRGGLPHQDRVFLGSGGALQPQVKKSSLTSPPHRLPINSRPRRPSRLSRSSARSRSRTAPSPSGSACAPATPSGALPSRFHQTPPQAQWGKLLDFFRVPFAVDLSLTIRVPPSRTARYNAKRRHWRRTKLNF